MFVNERCASCKMTYRLHARELVAFNLTCERGVSLCWPSELGYGDRDLSLGSKFIPAGSVLILEIELVKVVCVSGCICELLVCVEHHPPRSR